MERSDAGMYDRIVKNEKDLDELGISVVIAKLLSELVEINDCTLPDVLLQQPQCKESSSLSRKTSSLRSVA